MRNSEGQGTLANPEGAEGCVCIENSFPFELPARATVIPGMSYAT